MKRFVESYYSKLIEWIDFNTCLFNIMFKKDSEKLMFYFHTKSNSKPIY